MGQAADSVLVGGSTFSAGDRTSRRQGLAVPRPGWDLEAISALRREVAAAAGTAVP